MEIAGLIDTLADYRDENALRRLNGAEAEEYNAKRLDPPAIGAEGLEIHDGGNIVIADTPASFAHHCLELLDNAVARQAITGQASRIVAEKYSWESVTTQFERLLA